jgi:hypothetical protein
MAKRLHSRDFSHGPAIFRRLATRYPRPVDVQRFLRSLPYNREHDGETLRSADAAMKIGTAHCLEAAFLAAAVLERRGYPPLVMSLESQDQLDHVVYVFQDRRTRLWGAIARSRDEGLHGRKPVFRTLRDLTWSYVDPYVDKTGRITGYGVANLDDSGSDWRFSKKNVWKAEQYLIDLPHRKLRSSNARYRERHRGYLAGVACPRRPEWW